MGNRDVSTLLSNHNVNRYFTCLSDWAWRQETVREQLPQDHISIIRFTTKTSVFYTHINSLKKHRNNLSVWEKKYRKFQGLRQNLEPQITWTILLGCLTRLGVAQYLLGFVCLHSDCVLTLAIRAMYFKSDSNELLALYGRQGTQISDVFPYKLFCSKMCTFTSLWHQQSPAD